MRIALYTDSYTPSVDGVSAVVQAYARELPRFGAVCCVFAPAFPGTLPAVGVRRFLPFRCRKAFSTGSPFRRQIGHCAPANGHLRLT